jgi:hypothetical protein
MAVGLVRGCTGSCKVCGKLRPKPVENKGKILPGGTLAVSGLGCSIGRGTDACCRDPVRQGRNLRSTTVGMTSYKISGEAGRKSVKAKALSYRNGENSVKATCRG